MKRAQPGKVASTPFQGHKIGYDLLHAGGIKYLRYCIVRDQGPGIVLELQNNEKMGSVLRRGRAGYV